MCQSLAEGGRRCAAHTRPALRQAEAAYEANPSIENEDALAEARAAHASTPAGHDEITIILRALSESDPERDRLRRALRAGYERDMAAREIETRLKWEPKARSSSSAARAEAISAQKRWAINNLSDETLNGLSRDEDPIVVKTLAGYKGKLPDEAQDRLAAHSDPEIRRALVRSQERITAHVARTLVDDPVRDVRVDLAKQYVLPDDVVARLQADNAPSVRAALLYSRPDGHQLASERGRSRAVVINGLRDPSVKVREAALHAWHRSSCQPIFDGDRPGNRRIGTRLWAMPDADLVTRLRNDPSERIREMTRYVFEGSEGRWDWHPGMPNGPVGRLDIVE